MAEQYTVATMKKKMEAFKQKPELLMTNESWGEGEWLKEPGINEPQFYIFEGMPCYLNRSYSSGSWNGYVGVNPAHPICREEYIEIDLQVHGGLTYGELGLPFPIEKTKYEDLFYFGFDCAHARDYAPKIEASLKFMRSIDTEKSDHGDLLKKLQELDEEMSKMFNIPLSKTYKTMKYAQGQLDILAGQIVHWSNKHDRYATSLLIRNPE